ncbi:MAG: hypothetical protein WA056_13870 [Gallionella sp.]
MKFHFNLHSMLAILIAGILVNQPVEANEYEQGLSKVYGAAKTIEATVDICGESFPQTLEVNKAAYLKWRERHISLLITVERQQERSKQKLRQSWEFAKSDKRIDTEQLAKAGRMLEMLDKLPSIVAGEAKRQYQSKGKIIFESICINYPASIASENANFDQRFAYEISLINANEQKYREMESKAKPELLCTLTIENVNEFSRDQLQLIITKARQNHPFGPDVAVLGRQVTALAMTIDICAFADSDTKEMSATNLENYIELFTYLEKFMAQWKSELPANISGSDAVLGHIEELRSKILATP